MKNKPNKITTTLKVVITGEFYDDEASEETLRYCAEQDLEDAGFDVDVELLKEQEPVKPIKSKLSFTHGFDWDIWDCGYCGNQLRSFAKYCDQCGQAVKWND